MSKRMYLDPKKAQHRFIHRSLAMTALANAMQLVAKCPQEFRYQKRAASEEFDYSGCSDCIYRASIPSNVYAVEPHDSYLGMAECWMLDAECGDDEEFYRKNRSGR